MTEQTTKNESQETRLERAQAKKFKTYEAAAKAKLAWKPDFDKVKTIARNDGTYDVVAYKKIEKAEKK